MEKTGYDKIGENIAKGYSKSRAENFNPFGKTPAEREEEEKMLRRKKLAEQMQKQSSKP